MLQPLRPALSRRQALALAGAGLSLPRLAAADSEGDRRFLFISCGGGWDQTYLGATRFDSPYIHMPMDSAPAEVNGIRFVDGEFRPSVRQVFEDYGHRAALINGYEIRSIAHEICFQLMMTGSTNAGLDDWSSVIAANGLSSAVMPLAHYSGPSFTKRYAREVVRVGTAGQLPELLSGDLPARATGSRVELSSGAESLLDEYALRRAQARVVQGRGGSHSSLLVDAADMESRLVRLQELSGELELATGASLAEQVLGLLRLLISGTSRVGMLAYNSWNGVFNGWDSHQGNEIQGPHYEELFGAILGGLDLLSTSPGLNGETALDDVTIVVLSEMGRFPRLNETDGKDHWTFTSALMVGGRVRGGQTIGDFDEQCMGLPVDLASGGVSGTGEDLLPGHIGATLLALADVDPAEFISDAGPISAVVG